MINLNSALEEELYFQYLRDPDLVSQEWRKYFDSVYGQSKFTVPKFSETIATSSAAKVEDKFGFSNRSNPSINNKSSNETIKDYEYLEELDSTQNEFATRLSSSHSIPTATAMRTMPVKALEENRRIINRYMTKLRKRNVSFTHLLAWATAKALLKFPNLNDRYIEIEGKAYRVKRKALNIGLAVDLLDQKGNRILLVPSIKNCESMDFKEFFEEFNFLIEKTRNNELSPEDLSDTTITLTNPGMIGTSYSIPRLLENQGVIIAAGSIDYPVEFQAVRLDALTKLAVSKVVTITNTYDHRIIHGAESAEFLAYVNKLLIGKDRFFEQIFFSLNIPFEPVKWSVDNTKDSYWGIDQESLLEKGAHVMRMINAYRVRGHLLANINPLGFDSYYYPELDPAYYGFTIWDLDRIFHADDSWEENNIPLRDIIEILRETYCSRMGIEFMHIQSPEKKDWIKTKLELNRSTFEFSKEEKIHVFKKLIEAETFENYLHTKFVGHKRFSLEGGEAVIVLIDKIFEKSCESDLNSVVLGMAHRGRLNVLANLISKSYARIFKEFDGEIDTSSYQGSGDVKYHLGAKGVYSSPLGKEIEVILSPNPSHLELVDPVVLGMTRALDNEIGDKLYTKNLSVLVHGDSAFAGQGIVAEILNLTQLEGYKNGGTIHIIINNQIGFTTTSDSARSTIYATDIAKMIQVPILHVNGNDPDLVRAAAEFACDYRNKFGSDVIIDMLCYRKYGHNEADEPSYTQPLLYKKIKSMTHITKLYESQLIDEGIINYEEAEILYKEALDKLDAEYQNRKNIKRQSNYKVIPNKKSLVLSKIDSSISLDSLELISLAITSPPKNFNIHSKVGTLLRKRAEMVSSDEPKID
jgi:multifunctional 2-oxoglutarate metabolism enzyme